MNPSERRKKCSKCGNFIDDEDILCLDCAEEMQYNKGFTEGKADGYQEGFEKGREKGFKEALEIISEEVEWTIEKVRKKMMIW